MTGNPDDEHELELFGAMKRIENKNRKRGHATFWNTDNKSQGFMEVDAARNWAQEMNKRGHSIPICKIEENRDGENRKNDPPDVLAEMDGEKIGVEATELVDEKAIKEHPKIPPLMELVEPGPHALDKFPQPIPLQWPLDKFRKHLQNLVLDKEKKARKKEKRAGKDSSLSKQFLLIVTDEDWLDEATLSEYLQTTKLQPPRYFDGVYVMMAYVPADGEGHYQVFEVTLAG